MSIIRLSLFIGLALFLLYSTTPELTKVSGYSTDIKLPRITANIFFQRTGDEKSYKY